MAYMTEEKFTFVSRGLPEDTFGVVHFHGNEGLSQLYQFDILLVSDRNDIDLGQILKDPVKLVHHREEEDIVFHGLLAAFEQRQSYNEFTFYRATLVPRLWMLTMTDHNQVFLDKTVPEIIEQVLKDGGLTTDDFRLSLQKTYPVRPYVCQYGESYFNFITRWMEHEGIHYFFEQTDDKDVLVITDTNIAHQPMPDDQTVRYAPPSGLETLLWQEVVHHFFCRQNRVPHKVILKDYNSAKPSLDLTCEAVVSPDGLGEVYLYGEHYHTPEEGNALAKIRAEGFLCREKTFEGEGGVPFLRPGYLFTLDGHYRPDFSQEYLTIEIVHQGNQTGYLLDGIQPGLTEPEQTMFYRNTFTAIPSSVQFRPQRQAEKIRFYGSMNAKIDAAASGEYAEVDGEGRYKVILPFDLSGRKDGKASACLRMMQPYAGAKHGMHFPLHKGTEVLLTFIDGDPDKPVIAGALPNPENPSLIASGNQTSSVIQSSGGNQLVMKDQEGQQYLAMYSPYHGSCVGVGSGKEGGGGSLWEYTLGNKDSFILGDSTGIAVGAVNKGTVGVSNSLFIGAKSDLAAGWQYKWCLGRGFSYKHGRYLDTGPGSTAVLKKSKSVAAIESAKMEAGPDGVSMAAATGTFFAAGAAAAATAALGIGTGMMSGFYGKKTHDPKKDKAGWLADSGTGAQVGLGVVWGAELVAGIALLITAQIALDTLWNAFKKAPKAGTVSVDAKGIHAKALKVGLKETPKIDMVCAAGPDPALALKKANLELSNDSFSVETKGIVSKASLKMEKGNKITLAQGTTGGQVKIDKAGVKMEKRAGGVFVVAKAAKGGVQHPGGKTELALTATVAQMRTKGALVKCGPAGITIRPGPKLKAGPLSITGGKLVKIG